jgi:hypothetical protein
MWHVDGMGWDGMGCVVVVVVVVVVVLMGSGCCGGELLGGMQDVHGGNPEE